MLDGNPLVDDLNLRIVQGLANGETQVALSGRLYLSRRAIRGRLHRLRKQHDAGSNAQLIAIALRQGWIE